MICEKCNKKLMYVRDVVGDPFMYCPDCRSVWVEMTGPAKGAWYERVNK